MTKGQLPGHATPAVAQNPTLNSAHRLVFILCCHSLEILNKVPNKVLRLCSPSGYHPSPGVHLPEWLGESWASKLLGPVRPAV